MKNRPTPRPATSPFTAPSIPAMANMCRIIPATRIIAIPAMMKGVFDPPLAGRPSAPTGTPAASIQGFARLMYQTAPKANPATAATNTAIAPISPS